MVIWWGSEAPLERGSKGALGPLDLGIGKLFMTLMRCRSSTRAEGSLKSFSQRYEHVDNLKLYQNFQEMIMENSYSNTVRIK